MYGKTTIYGNEAMELTSPVLSCFVCPQADPIQMSMALLLK